MASPTVSSLLIFEAMKYYDSLEYSHCDVPLVVDRDVSAICKPESCKDIEHEYDKVYVGSAEQGFLQLLKHGVWLDGKNMALTPCMRDESSLSPVHFRTFLKLELIDVNSRDFLSVAKHALQFFIDTGISCHMVSTPIGIDIIHTPTGLELGSYGVRSYLGIDYVYGTGIAEPRASIALDYDRHNF